MTDDDDFIPDALLLSNGVDKFSPDTPIRPKQAARLLGIPTTRLRDWRRDGKPPPFQQHIARGGIRYPLGGVLAARKSHIYNNTAEARVAHKAERSGFANFAAFCAGAALNDEWPFDLIDDGKPIDFFAALSMESADYEGDENDGDCRWLTLADYLSMRLRWAQLDASRRYAEVLGDVLPHGKVFDGSVLPDLCPRCRKPAHPGRCRI